MKPGLVVAIRVSPKDCQSVLAMMDASGLPRVNQSFASMVSMVLSGLLQGVRADGIIEEPDPFLYWDQMGQYHKGSSAGKKDAIADAVRGRVKTVASMNRRQTEEEALANSPPVDMTTEQRQAGLRMKELMVKQEHAADSWSTEDQEEFNRLEKIVYGG